MSPNGFVYFDFYQTDRVEEEPLANGGYLPVEKVYSFEPVPADQLTAEEQNTSSVHRPTCGANT